MKIPSFLKNKYFYTIIGFIVWMLFFDGNNIISQIKLSNQLKELKREENYYKNQIEKDKEIIKALSSDSSALEKLAREKYLMKKENEDIFLIIEDDEK
ncbi:MAG: septum formation initiator family protein [Bacteroidales bacterium]|nr:septum formation initiator family protein [Bacteroidales bacterium]